MTAEGLQNYLGARIPLVLTPDQYLRLLRTVFALVFLMTLAVHVLVEQETAPLGMFVHATAIGLVYVVAVGLATTVLFFIRGSAKDTRVWHVWLASLASFTFGYYFLPIDGWLALLFGTVSVDHSAQMRMSQLLPVWFVLTYVFVQPYLSEGLKSELSRLCEINSLLRTQHPEHRSATSSSIRFQSGRTEFTLDAAVIRNVAVDDHYCYVHYRKQGGYTKRDLAMPLRDVGKLLPREFLYVHRSHIVNPDFIKAIRREKRAIRVVLDGEYEVPVSRHRLEDVLPKIRQQIESRDR